MLRRVFRSRGSNHLDRRAPNRDAATPHELVERLTSVIMPAVSKRTNLVLFLLAVVVSALVSRSFSRPDSSILKGAFSAWNVKPGMTFAEVSEHLPEAPFIQTGVLYYCQACDPSSWSGQTCREHLGGGDSEARGPERGLLNFHEGRVTALSSPYIQKDGVRIFAEGDSLQQVLGSIDNETVVRHDEWSTTVTLPSEGLVVELHGDTVYGIHLVAPSRD